MLETANYHKAFIHYLRQGVPLRFSLKAEAYPNPHYIWRTSGDNKVRPEHVANNGKIFAWDNPPETGHPGEAYGCRCRAEPYVQGESEYAKQSLITIVDEGLNRWQWPEFLQYFYFGNGQPITLWAIGHLREILNSVEQDHGIYLRQYRHLD